MEDPTRIPDLLEFPEEDPDNPTFLVPILKNLLVTTYSLVNLIFHSMNAILLDTYLEIWIPKSLPTLKYEPPVLDIPGVNFLELEPAPVLTVQIQIGPVIATAPVNIGAQVSLSRQSLVQALMFLLILQKFGRLEELELLHPKELWEELNYPFWYIE